MEKSWTEAFVCLLCLRMQMFLCGESLCQTRTRHSLFSTKDSSSSLSVCPSHERSHTVWQMLILCCLLMTQKNTLRYWCGGACANEFVQWWSDNYYWLTAT